MGTRSDYYVGVDPEKMEWLGSNAWDGYVDGVIDEENVGKEGRITPAFVVDEHTWRQEVDHYLSYSTGCTWPEEGWPWPWEDSNTTDYAYTYHEGQILVASFGGKWFTLKQYAQLYDIEEEVEAMELETFDEREAERKRRSGLVAPAAPDAVFPNMKDRQNVRMDKGSGLMLIGAGPTGITDLANEPVANRGNVRYVKAHPAIREGEVEPNPGDVLQGVAQVLFNHQERKLNDQAAIAKIRLLVS
jgi:hypothetical protein